MIEVDHQDLYQRAGLAVCAFSSDAVDIERRLQRVEATVERNWSGNILSWEIDVIQV